VTLVVFINHDDDSREDIVVDLACVGLSRDWDPFIKPHQLTYPLIAGLHLLMVTGKQLQEGSLL